MKLPESFVGAENFDASRLIDIQDLRDILSDQEPGSMQDELEVGMPITSAMPEASLEVTLANHYRVDRDGDGHALLTFVQGAAFQSLRERYLWRQEPQLLIARFIIEAARTDVTYQMPSFVSGHRDKAAQHGFVYAPKEIHHAGSPSAQVKLTRAVRRRGPRVVTHDYYRASNQTDPTRIPDRAQEMAKKRGNLGSI